jgi:hypothetical protein
MEKIALTPEEQARANLRTGIKDRLDKLKILVNNPTQNNVAAINKKIDDVLREMLTFIDGQIPNKPIAAPAAKADDAETKVPAFWRKNLDYGEK